MSSISRRNVLAGAAAAAAVNSVIRAMPACADDNETPLQLFVKVSAGLTGIAEKKLAPARDPINIKQAYFDRASNHRFFEDLLAIVRKNQAESAEKIADIVINQSGPDVQFLARSIILAWYLGAWYAPEVLRSPPPGPLHFEIISPAAYTQAWVWRVAQAHPMGYSEWSFGYWSKLPPVDLDGFVK